MALVRMNISTIVVGGSAGSSLVVLKPHHRRGSNSVELPIRIGSVESSAISMGIDGSAPSRPLTHDLLKSVISSLGAALTGVVINDVRGTTFYAQLRLLTPDGERVQVDARPSDAIALAVRMRTPIYAEESVLDTAALPDFRSVEEDEERQELQRFHDFVEGLNPEDFNAPDASKEDRGSDAPSSPSM